MRKKILFVVGSLRKESFNHSLSEYVKELIGEKAEVELLEYSNIPYMNQDVEYPAPKKISEVREKVSKVDGIWIFSPEYNFAIPGVLKNLLDWLSRPLVQYDFQGPSAVHEKKVTISGAAGGTAAANVRKQLSDLLPFIRMNLIGGEGTGVALPMESFQTNKLILNDETKTLLKNQVDELLKSI